MPKLFPLEDLLRMRDQLFFDGEASEKKYSRFWILLILAAIIATAGVVSDSTATVIGAMIVAPLMTPILGIVLAIVTADGKNLLRSVVLVVCGSIVVIAIAWSFGHLLVVDIDAATSSQVAGRVHPRLIDLMAALATGAVGAFALARSDISDTLPGVAIAISLVPPLAVVGLTLEAGAMDESLGALLLFLTNVGAIVLSGLIVLALFHVREASAPDGRFLGSGGHRLAVLASVAFVAVLSIFLTVSSVQFSQERIETGEVNDVAMAWAEPAGWEVVKVDVDHDAVLVRAVGPLPSPDSAEFRQLLDAAGLESVDVKLQLVPEERIELPGR